MTILVLTKETFGTVFQQQFNGPVVEEEWLSVLMFTNISKLGRSGALKSPRQNLAKSRQLKKMLGIKSLQPHLKTTK